MLPARRSNHLLLITLPPLHRALLYSTSLQCTSALRCGLVSPGTPSLLFTQAWIRTLSELAYDGSQTGKVLHSSPASAVSALVKSGWVCSILSHFVTDQRRKIEGRGGNCMWVLNTVCLCVAGVGGQRQESFQRLTFPSFWGAKLQVIPCTTVGVQVGCGDPPLLLCGADKPPACERTATWWRKSKSK